MTDSGYPPGLPGAQSALRGLEILEVLAGLDQPASLARIAERAELNESAAYRTLRRLAAEGYIDHVPRAGYRLGSRSVALAALVGPEPPLMRAAQQVLTRVVTTSGQSAAMHLRSGQHRVLVTGIQSPIHPLHEEAAVGERARLTSGSAGLVILAHLPQDEIDELIGDLPASDPPVGMRDLEAIRAAGFRIGRRRREHALRGISAPMLDPESGSPLGSLTIAGVGQHAADQSLRRQAPLLFKACADLAPRLAAHLGPSASRGRRGLDVRVRWRE